MVETAETATVRVDLAQPEQRGESTGPPLNADELHEMIARAAYYIAEHRGFEPGHETDDWLQAEEQVHDWLVTGKT